MSSSMTPLELTIAESVVIILSIDVEEWSVTLVGEFIRDTKLLVARVFVKSWQMGSLVFRVSMLKSPHIITSFFSCVALYKRESRCLKNFWIGELGDLYMAAIRSFFSGKFISIIVISKVPSIHSSFFISSLSLNFM